MKNAPLAMIACAIAGLVALLALPWVARDGISLTLTNIITLKGHGHQVAYFILAPLVLAIVIGAVSMKKSYRWLTGLVGFLLLIPTVLSAVAKNAAIGAHVGLAASALAALCAIMLTVKPVKPARPQM